MSLQRIKTVTIKLTIKLRVVTVEKAFFFKICFFSPPLCFFNGPYSKFNSSCINLIVMVLILRRDMTNTKGPFFFRILKYFNQFFKYFINLKMHTLLKVLFKFCIRHKIFSFFFFFFFFPRVCVADIYTKLI